MPTIQEIFSAMPSQLKADKAAGVNLTLLFDLSGSSGGQWTLTIADGAAKIEEGRHGSPQATLFMDVDDYIDLVMGKLNPMTGFMGGKIKVQGDMGKVMQVQSLFGA